MQFNVVYLETHPSVTLWLFDLHPSLFEHNTKIFSSKGHCFIVSCEVGLIGLWKGFVFPIIWSEVEVLFPVILGP
jgi:hypothetical protein